MAAGIDNPERKAKVWGSPRRMLLAGAGVFSVGLGFTGLFVPGLPTTIFLILASFFFTRSCPWLEERVMNLRVFRPFRPYVLDGRPMPARARVVALSMMWTAVGASLAVLALGDRLPAWLAVAVVAAAALGSVVILTVRRAPVTAADRMPDPGQESRGLS